MNERLRYELRGLAYWAECANPLRSTVTARQLPLDLRIEGYKRDAVGRGLYRRGVYEPALTSFLLNRFANSQGGNFLDIGANIGYFSCLLGKLAGTAGKVLAIEAEPNNFRLLERNLRNNGLPNVTPLNFAVGSADGVAKMGIYKAANRGRHSLVDLESCREFREVPVRTLDHLTAGMGVSQWHFAKMDVEGYEPFVLAGAQKTLARMDLLAMEYAPSYWKKAGVEAEPVLRTLIEQFRRVYRLLGAEPIPFTIEECVASAITLDLLFEK
jgi:FkbM family methyltransferase